MSTPFFTEVDGVIFCESALEGTPIAAIQEVGATQNTILGDIKKVMAYKARAMGGDAVIHFRYTQKADKGLHLFKWDKERLNCTGTVIKLSADPRNG